MNGSSHTKHQCNKYMNDDDWHALEASCLTDNVANAAQLLMKTNNDNGLHDTVLIAANAVKLAAGNKLVHDTSAAHWLVSTNLGCSADAVRIYCSLNMKPSNGCVQNIMKFVNAPKSQSKLRLKVMNVAKQTGAKDCGLFAIAFAQRLLSGLDPTTVVFDQESMRSHLKSCLTAGEISSFPTKSNRVTRRKVLKKFEVSAYCTCREGSLPKRTMIACDACHEWFHQTCIRMTDEEFSTYRTNRNKKYLCEHCKTV